MNRRNIIKTMVLSGGASMISPKVFSAMGPTTMKSNSRILFQGDSITDAGRDRDNTNANNPRALGHGYATQIAGLLLKGSPEEGYKFFNKGISGNKVFQLSDRWEEDCLKLEPDVLSILIGVNDFWHMKNGKYDGTPEIYERDYRALLSRTLEALPAVKIIICEPFLVEGGKAVGSEWPAEFAAYRKAAARISDDFDFPFVEFQTWFNDALTLAPASYWCPDGVHPSLAGANLMAEAWLRTFRSL